MSVVVEDRSHHPAGVGLFLVGGLLLVDVFQLDLAQLGGLLRADRVFFLLELLEDGGVRLLPLLLGFLQLLIELRADLFEVLLQLVFGIVETAGELGRDFLFGRRALFR